MRLIKLARDVGCSYSRYADDLTFSTNKRTFPPEVALPSPDGTLSHEWLPGERVREIIERSGFRINGKKTHVMYRTSRQEVTGLVVNQKISVRSGYRRNVRAMVHKLVTSGTFDLWAAVPKDGSTVVDKRTGSLDELHGMLGFIHSIDRHNRKNAATSARTPTTSEEKTYSQFLFYKTFYAVKCPIVVCEGETDNVYLTHAIRSLANEFPDLAELLPDGKIRIVPRLYKYHQSSSAQLMELKGGGYGVLAKFIGNYSKNVSIFGGPVPAHPVIVLYDNDDAAKKIRSAIKDITKKHHTEGDAQFLHVTKNLYTISTPGVGSKIEDFFDDATKNIELDGKSFNDSNDFDPDKFYGKNVFAHRIVRSNADSLDFSGFRPLLTNLSAAIQDYAARVSSTD